MTCESCGEKPKNQSKDFTKAVVEIDNPEKLILFRKVVIPASLGDQHTLPPAVGKYYNVLLEYEKTGALYLYSSDGIPTGLSNAGGAIGDGVLTIQFNGDTVARFSANSTEDVVANIEVENVNGVGM